MTPTHLRAFQALHVFDSVLAACRFALLAMELFGLDSRYTSFHLPPELRLRAAVHVGPLQETARDTERRETDSICSLTPAAARASRRRRLVTLIA
jgi:hypothetical protein